MFCYKCGAQIPDDSAFCFKCGTKITMTGHEPDAFNKYVNDNIEIDKKALSIYLNDLLGLEFILHKYRTKLSKWENELDGYISRNMSDTYYNDFFPSGDDDWLNYYARDDFTSGRYSDDHVSEYRTCFHFAYVGSNEKYYILMEKDYYNGTWFPWTRYSTWNRTVEWREIDDSLKELKAWDHSLIQSPPIRNSGIFGGLRKRDALLRASRAFEKSFSAFKTECKQGLINNQRVIDKLESNIKGLKEEKEKFENALQRAYSLNIVPKQFRNIYAVYYLNDFIQSSRESLTTALLHFDLKQIQNKLDKIIDQLEEIIINQKILEAQNEQLLQQNQEYLKRFDRLEKTGKQILGATRDTAMYAELAASNAEAAALIGLANYLRS